MTFSEIMGVIIATAVTFALRWAAHKWPIPEGKPHKHKRKNCQECEEES